MIDSIESAPAFHAALAAPGRSPEIPADADAYGWLVGSWRLDVLRYWAVDVSGQGLAGEVHAGWTLEGRAVQDVWIMPPRDRRLGPPDRKQNMYGTTLRTWDASLEAWRIVWSNPAGLHFEEQVGRLVRPNVIQLGTRPDGTKTRWTFSEITPDSFHWRGESRAAEGGAWTLEGEFLATRTA